MCIGVDIILRWYNQLIVVCVLSLHFATLKIGWWYENVESGATAINTWMTLFGWDNLRTGFDKVIFDSKSHFLWIFSIYDLLMQHWFPSTFTSKLLPILPFTTPPNFPPNCFSTTPSLHFSLPLKGCLWRYCRASMSIAGLYPPICDYNDGHYLIDGCYTNNVPGKVACTGGISRFKGLRQKYFKNMNFITVTSNKCIKCRKCRIRHCYISVINWGKAFLIKTICSR